MANGKEKFALWLTPESKELVKQLYREDDCKSQSEYIEKPSFKMKMHLRKRVAHAFFTLGFCGLVLPKYTPRPRSENQLFC